MVRKAMYTDEKSKQEKGEKHTSAACQNPQKRLALRTVSSILRYKKARAQLPQSKEETKSRSLSGITNTRSSELAASANRVVPSK